jgi:hypothetical protein
MVTIVVRTLGAAQPQDAISTRSELVSAISIESSSGFSKSCRIDKFVVKALSDEQNILLAKEEEFLFDLPFRTALVEKVV